MADEKETIKCPKCGTENSSDNKFCENCGVKIENKASDNTKSASLTFYQGIELTKDEVIKSNAHVGKSSYMQIFLKDISSIQLHYKSHPVLILLAIISLIASHYCYGYLGTVCFGLSLIFFIAFFMLRRHYLIITARGGEEMSTIVTGSDKAKNFVASIVQAKREVM